MSTGILAISSGALQSHSLAMHSRQLLHAAAGHAADFLESLDERPVRAEVADPRALHAALGGPIPERGENPCAVLDALVANADPGIVASQSPRYFGFVLGGALPASIVADWMAAAWDQNGGGYILSPASGVLHEVVGEWCKDLLGLPAHASHASVTGTQMAHVTCLAVARHHVLGAAGWDAQADGLQGAPRVRVVVGEHRHVTIERAVRLLGLGTNALVPVEADEHGRMRPEALRETLAAGGGPTIVCLQAGEVNTGSFDPFVPLVESAHAAGAWVHVDGAFGLWAAASPRHRHLMEGAAGADSWATDGHKWLNVPYDSGMLFTAHPESHRVAMSSHAAYLSIAGEGERNEDDWAPDFSRRSRAIALYGALRSLGREGVAELVGRCCDCAARFAERLGAEPDVEVLNDVVINQTLVRFGDDDALTDAVVAAVQDEGTCWMSATTWRGRRAMRISVSNWATTLDDVDRSAEAILRCLRSAAVAR
jgi:glutamate/tyrosine decarboxylase-like PLP-dependent enzyme